MAQFFGVMLIVVGLLLAALCGLCTLVVAGGSLSTPRDPQGYGGGGMVGIALLLGGVPTLFGWDDLRRRHAAALGPQAAGSDQDVRVSGVRASGCPVTALRGPQEARGEGFG